MLIVADDDNAPRRDAIRNVFLIIPFILKSYNCRKCDVTVIRCEDPKSHLH